MVDGRRAAPSRRSRDRGLTTCLSLRFVQLLFNFAFFRDEHRSDGSGEAVTGTFADLVGGAQTCPAGTPARVVLPGRFGEASHLPVSEARRSGFARPACDLWRLVVALMPHCSLRRRPVVDVAFRPAAFDMRCNSRPARQNTTRPFRSRNESVPERLSAVR